MLLAWCKFECTGRHSDKKPPFWTKTLDFLAQNGVERPKFLRPKIKKIFCEREGSGGRQPPEGSSIPPFPSCTISTQEIVFSEAESFDFRAKKFGNQPQDFSLRRQSGGRHPDKILPVWTQTLNLLAKNRADNPKFLESKFQTKLSRAGEFARAAAPPRGHPSLPFQAARYPLKKWCFRKLRVSISGPRNLEISPKISYQ